MTLQLTFSESLTSIREKRGKVKILSAGFVLPKTYKDD